MKQHVLMLFAVIAAAAAGCGKSSDLAPTAAEAKGIAEAYQARVAELDKRAQDLARRGEALGLAPTAPGGDQLYDAARTIIPEMQGLVKDALAKIPRLVGDDKLDDQKKLAELRAYAHELEERLSTDWLKARTKLDAAEAWLFRAESRPRIQPAVAPAPTPAQPEPEPAAAAPPH